MKFAGPRRRLAAGILVLEYGGIKVRRCVGNVMVGTTAMPEREREREREMKTRAGCDRGRRKVACAVGSTGSTSGSDTGRHLEMEIMFFHLYQNFANHELLNSPNLRYV